MNVIWVCGVENGTNGVAFPDRGAVEQCPHYDNGHCRLWGNGCTATKYGMIRGPVEGAADAMMAEKKRREAADEE